MKYVLVMVLLLLISACTTIDATPEGPIEETPLPEQDNSSEDYDLEIIIGENNTTNNNEQENNPEPLVPFEVKNATSYGLFFGSGTAQYRHDFIQLPITANKELNLSLITIYSETKSIKYDGKFSAELRCINKPLVLARQTGGFGVVENVTSVRKGQTVQLCVPTPITMTRNEIYPLQIYYEGVQIYDIVWRYPANIQNTVVDLAPNVVSFNVTIQ